MSRRSIIWQKSLKSLRVNSVYDAEMGNSVCVLDTKYKAKDRPDTDDVAKVVIYAEMKNCDKAILIYPQPLAIPLDERVAFIYYLSLSLDDTNNKYQHGARNN